MDGNAVGTNSRVGASEANDECSSARPSGEALRVFEDLGCQVEEAVPDYPPERIWSTVLTWRWWSVLKGHDLYADPISRADVDLGDHPQHGTEADLRRRHLDGRRPGHGPARLRRHGRREGVRSR